MLCVKMGNPPRPTEQIPCTKSARTQLPLLASPEQRVIEQRSSLANLGTHHKPEAEQMSVNSAACCRLSCEGIVIFDSATKEREPSRDLDTL